MCGTGAVDFDDIRTVLASFDGTRILEASGDVFALYDPHGDLPPERQFPWATLVGSDVHDEHLGRVADLFRSGVFRLNLGLPRARCAEVVDRDAAHDFAALDVLMPHPVYGDHHWVCVLNPSSTWPAVRGLIAEAHAFAVRKLDNTARRHGDV